jgi:predicted aspartyl protease
LKLRLKYNLPFVVATLSIKGQEVVMDEVLVDTGSASSVFIADKLFAIGMGFEPTDMLKRVYGVGGSEIVFTKKIDSLQVGDMVATNFEITVGAMDYGIELDGILGMDFLQRVGAVIDLRHLVLEQHKVN